MKYLFLLLMLFSTNIYSQAKIKLFDHSRYFNLDTMQKQIDEFTRTNKILSVSATATEGRYLIVILYE